jgi:hypothetical protein
MVRTAIDGAVLDGIAEPIACKASVSTKNVANDDLGWFAIEVVE